MAGVVLPGGVTGNQADVYPTLNVAPFGMSALLYRADVQVYADDEQSEQLDFSFTYTNIFGAPVTVETYFIADSEIRNASAVPKRQSWQLMIAGGALLTGMRRQYRRLAEPSR